MSRLSNFYILGNSSRLIMRKSFKLLVKLRVSEKFKSRCINDFNQFFDIADAACKNNVYKYLLSLFELKDLSFDEIYQTANKLLFDKCNFTVLQKLEEYEPNNRNSSSSEKLIDFSKINSRIILLWKLNKYSVKSIAMITNTSKEFVCEWISKYKRGVKKLCKIKQRNSWRKRKIVTNDIIEKIREFCCNPKHQPITIKKIKRCINNQKHTAEFLSYTTVRSILRNELKMSYKILHKCHKKVMTKEHMCLFAESLSLQLKMYYAIYEVIYIDEFSFSSRK